MRVVVDDSLDYNWIVCDSVYFFFKQKTAYEMRISDWSSDVCSSDLPTEEDKHWFPDIAGSDWLTTVKFAMNNFKDESFILQFLSPKVIRDLKKIGRASCRERVCQYV